jgi:ABC-type multidrug transport system fused ATPase/permease subunit
VVGKNGVQLSGGEQQLIALARALYDHPAIVIVDEGMYAMDLDLQETTLRILKKYARSKAVVLISHNLDMILRADHVYIMDRGGVIEQGDPFTLLENSSSRLAVLYFKQNPLMPMLMNQRSFSAAS